MLGTNNTSGSSVRRDGCKGRFGIVHTNLCEHPLSGLAVQVTQASKKFQILHHVHTIDLKAKIFRNNYSVD